MQLKEFDILLIKQNNTIIQSIVHKVTGEEYNHSELYLGNYLILEAMPDGVKIKPMYNDLGEFDVFRYKDGFTKEQKELIREFIQKKLNSKYDFLELFLQLFHIKRKENNKYICISLLMDAFKYAGIKIDDWNIGFKQVSQSDYFVKIN